MNKIIRGKRPFGRININVIKVEDNKPRVFEERIVGPRRKLPAETYNGELLLLDFVAATNLRY